MEALFYDALYQQVMGNSFCLRELIGKAKEGSKRWESWKEKIKNFMWWKLSSILFSAIKLNSDHVS